MASNQFKIFCVKSNVTASHLGATPLTGRNIWAAGYRRPTGRAELPLCPFSKYFGRGSGMKIMVIKLVSGA
jgi:hypothetical protein